MSLCIFFGAVLVHLVHLVHFCDPRRVSMQSCIQNTREAVARYSDGFGIFRVHWAELLEL